MLRTTNISPGRASKICAGSTRLSAQDEDHHLRALALGQLGPALALARPVVVAEAAIAVDQLASRYGMRRR